MSAARAPKKKDVQENFRKHAFDMAAEKRQVEVLNDKIKKQLKDPEQVKKAALIIEELLRNSPTQKS